MPRAALVSQPESAGRNLVGRLRSITRAADWERVRRAGASGRSDGVRVRALRRSPSTLPGRLGLRVRVAGRARAVTRNRVQRRLRAAWRDLPETAGVDAIVYGDESLAGKDFQIVSRDLSRALERALEGERQ